MLHALVYRTLQQTKPVTTVLQLQFYCQGFTSSSSNPNTSLTLEYLMNSCGLPLKTALMASKKLNLKSTENPDLVLTLLKNSGLTQNAITKLISRLPTMLKADVNKTIKPKIDFLTSLGVSGSRLVKIVTTDAQFLQRSLENQIIPSINFIKKFTDTDEEFFTILNQPSRIFQIQLENVMEPNIALLSDNGVPKHNIIKLFMLNPRTLASRNDRFRTIVEEIKEMGFDSRSPMFIQAIVSRSGMSKTRWEERWALMHKLGFSHAESLSMFKKHPKGFVLSKENVECRVKFFTVKQKFELSDIAKNPVILALALEKRIIPRCNVLEVLYSNGLIGSRNASSITSALKLIEKKFVEKFVTKYQDVLPQIVSAYKSQIRLAELKEEDGIYKM